jgi:hypothetical protein
MPTRVGIVTVHILYLWATSVPAIVTAVTLAVAAGYAPRLCSAAGPRQALNRLFAGRLHLLNVGWLNVGWLNVGWLNVGWRGTRG